MGRQTRITRHVDAYLSLGLLGGSLGGSRSDLLGLGLFGSEWCGLSSLCLGGLDLLNGSSSNGLSRCRHYEKLKKCRELDKQNALVGLDLKRQKGLLGKRRDELNESELWRDCWERIRTLMGMG